MTDQQKLQFGSGLTLIAGVLFLAGATTAGGPLLIVLGVVFVTIGAILGYRAAVTS